MRRPATQWALQGMLVLMLCCGARPLHAQTLDVCNKGTVTVEAVVAKRLGASLLGPAFWVITGTPVAPRACERVYDEGRGKFTGNQYPAYIGFGFTDSRGQWGSGTVGPVPDMGSSGTFSQTPILKKGEQALCVRQGKTNYRTADPLRPLNCATLQLRDDDAKFRQGPFVPLTTALYFQPERGSYVDEPFVGGGWVGGDYYLNIAPNATARDLHASLGSPDGTTPAPASSLCGAVSCQDQIAEAMRNYDPVKAAAAAEKAAAEAKAREEAQRTRQFEADAARDKALSRSVGDYSPDWMAQGLIVTGTVSRIGLEPMWAVLYFKESPNGDFVGCIPRKLFEGFGGKDFSGLVGKTVDLRGSVVRPLCGPMRAGTQVWTPSAIIVH